MIIQCESCQTKFNFDESLIKNRDLKVRCSRCKHVFSPFLPQQSEMEEEQPDLTDEEFDIADNESEAEPTADWDFDDGSEDDSMEDIDGLEALFGETAEDVSDETEELLDDEGIFGKEEPVVEQAYESEAEEVESLPTRKRSGRSRKWIVLLVIVAVLVGAGYGIYRFRPGFVDDFMRMVSQEKTPQQETSVDSGGSRLNILTVEGSFVSSQKLGRLFLIQGKVLNRYPGPRSFLRVKGSILDDTGKVVAERQVYAGNLLTEETISSLTMAQMEEVMENPNGSNNANLNVQPETSVDFSIVFEGLPDNVSHFEVEPVSSTPVAQGTE